jgi:diguanylate cyclase (GGDEF)-like protein/PAS domain S-box-containing protein
MNSNKLSQVPISLLVSVFVVLALYAVSLRDPEQRNPQDVAQPHWIDADIGVSSGVDSPNAFATNQAFELWRKARLAYSSWGWMGMVLISLGACLFGMMWVARWMTSKQRRKSILRDRDAHYRKSLQFTNTGSWEFDVKTQSVFWSSQVEVIWGLEPGSFRGDLNQVKACIHPDDVSLWEANIQACIETGIRHDLEFRLLRPDGSVCWVHGLGNADRDRQGRAIRLRGIVMDITERKVAESRLCMFERIVSTTQDGMVFIHCDFTYQIVNQAYASLLQTTPESLIGQSVAAMGGRNALSHSIAANLKRCFAGEFVEFQQLFHLQDDRVCYLDIRYVPYQAENEIIGAVVTIRDLTLLHHAQTQLALQARRAEALLELPQIAEHLNNRALLDWGQALATSFTQSAAAVIEVIDPTLLEEPIEVRSATNDVIRLQGGSPARSMIPRSIYAEVLRRGQALIVNHYATYQQDQGLLCSESNVESDWTANLERLAIVPAFDQGQVVLLVMAQNKMTDYDESDRETLQLIANEVWQTLKTRQTLTKLIASERSLREAQRVARVGSWDLDLVTRDLVWSDEVFRIFEVDPSEFVPSEAACRQLIHPEDLAKVEQACYESVANQTDYDVTHRLLTNGKIKHVHERGQTYYDPEGRPVRSVGTIQDVTEHVQAAEQLQQSAAVFRCTAEGVMITDRQANILDVNLAFTTITGYSRDEVIGQNSRLLSSERHDPNFYQAMWQQLTTEGKWRGEIWNRRKDGSVYPELLNISTFQAEDGEPLGYVGVFSDITTVKQSEAQLHYLAHHDPLTDLPNRLLFHDLLHQGVSRAARQSHKLAVIFIDLDRFKHVNDTMGHAAGDALLQEVARRLRQSVRANDTVARLSGDEFVILLENIKNARNVTVTINTLIQHFSKPCIVDRQELYITLSLGVSIFPDDGTDVAILLRNADTAMYEAKAAGRATYRFYSAEMTTAAIEQIELENALRSALSQHQFRLDYQPQIDLKSGYWVSIESKLSWQHPEKGVLHPEQFMAIAEQINLIPKINQWMLQSACHQAKVWLDQGLEFGRIIVKIIGHQNYQYRTDFIEDVYAALAASGLPPVYLGLGFSEALILEPLKEDVLKLQQLQEMGIEIQIDDFSTSYTSLIYIKQLPINKVKIASSFIQDIPEDKNDMAISEAIIALGKALEIQVIAEGVQTEEQAEFLRSRGCHEAQGQFYTKLSSADEIADLLKRTSPIHTMNPGLASRRIQDA